MIARLRARVMASFDATRPGVAEFGIALSVGILLAAGALSGMNL